MLYKDSKSYQVFFGDFEEKNGCGLKILAVFSVPENLLQHYKVKPFLE